MWLIIIIIICKNISIIALSESWAAELEPTLYTSTAVLKYFTV